MSTPPSVESLRLISSARVKGRIIEILADAYPRSVGLENMIWLVYGGKDEPEDAPNTLGATACHIRRDLKPFGWTITKARGGRGNLASWRLEPIAGFTAP